MASVFHLLSLRRRWERTGSELPFQKCYLGADLEQPQCCSRRDLDQPFGTGVLEQAVCYKRADSEGQ